MFRLPATLTVGRQYQALSHAEVSAFESSLPQHSRVLVGMVFAERYSGFETDCARADTALQQVAGLSAWPEFPQFVTPDPDGQPIAWVSYVASPEWQIIGIILGGIFLLPILGAFSLWVVEKIIPGFTEMITTIVMLAIFAGTMLFTPKFLVPAKEGT